MDPVTRSGVEARPEGQRTPDADIELGRRLVEWLDADPEGRRILRALEERPAVGRAALMRRLERPEFLQPLSAPPDNGDRPIHRVHASGRTSGLPRLLPLAGSGLLLGGLAAFMLGIFTLGHADPGFPPLSVFGISLMVLAAVPFAVGAAAARRPAPPLGATAQSLITIAMLVAAVAVAGAVAGWVG
ncbi:MAG TPA: hypothetical protein VF112_02210 [Candidatus Dormibacteraeota bacterium]